ncbi:hypothetical protein [Tepidibacillus marianensis]|uniref:hypothetical protein n=1 Tax=Tepidibacillus marianensis TaxID=3131995 RepID=UPI0030CC0BAB
MNVIITLYFIFSFFRLATNFMFLFLVLFHTTWVDIPIAFAIIGIVISIFMITYLSQMREHLQKYQKRLFFLLILDAIYFIVGLVLYPQYIKDTNLYTSAIFGHPLTFLINLGFVFYLFKSMKNKK